MDFCFLYNRAFWLSHYSSISLFPWKRQHRMVRTINFSSQKTSYKTEGIEWKTRVLRNDVRPAIQHQVDACCTKIFKATDTGQIRHKTTIFLLMVKVFQSISQYPCSQFCHTIVWSMLHTPTSNLVGIFC